MPRRGPDFNYDAFSFSEVDFRGPDKLTECLFSTFSLFLHFHCQVTSRSITMSLSLGRRENGQVEWHVLLGNPWACVLEHLKALETEGGYIHHRLLYNRINPLFLCRVSGGFTLNFIIGNIVCVRRCVCIIKPL